MKYKNIRKIDNDNYVIEYNDGEGICDYVVNRNDIYCKYKDDFFDKLDNNELNIAGDFINMNQPVNQYLKDVITKDQFLKHIQDLAFSVFKKKLANTKELESDKEAKEILKIWEKQDEDDYQKKLKENSNLQLEFGKTMDEISAIKDKQKLIDYYKNVLLPRLQEVK